MKLDRAQRNALVTRADLLGDYGRVGGGSAADRRLVVEAMAALEREARS